MSKKAAIGAAIEPTVRLPEDAAAPPTVASPAIVPPVIVSATDNGIPIATPEANIADCV
jgi:hypothetical protein